jgi:DNA-binding transcriptional regulator YhcF (GntR family)
MYQFNEDLNHNQFFWWENKLIENLNWALLSKSSKAVFPVIACHANNKGEAFPSEQTIGSLSGISDKTVRKGIRGLEVFPNFKFDYYLSRRGKRAKKFFFNIPSNNKRGSAFPFYKFILEAGIWRELRPSAKALYPVLRHFGFFDINLYAELEDLEISDFEEVFPDRQYDFCEADFGVLAKFANIHRNSVNTALSDLERNFLIEPLIAYSGWKVFLKSKDNTFWKRGYLNKKILNSYRHIIQRTKTTGDDTQILPRNAQRGAG